MYLVINSGSSSIKFKIFQLSSDNLVLFAEGLAERIGVDGNLIIKYNDKNFNYKEELQNHDKAVALILNRLLELGIIKDYDDITAIGSRVVHGGQQIKESVIIDEKILNIITECIRLAPLHNKGALVAISAFRKLLPTTPQIACFDTSYHQTIEDTKYLYPVPKQWYSNLEIRKYGFHGISYQYIVEKMADTLKKSIDDVNLVICHLGNGSSACCVKNGKSYDTTMGFTPLAGLMMGTRCGDIDPSIIEFVAKEQQLSVSEVTAILNQNSGLLGISGVSSDMRDIIKKMDEGDRDAKIAFEMFTDRISQTIVKFLNNFQLTKLDGIVFTAGIGENSHRVRERVIEKILLVDTKIDNSRNKADYNDVKLISSDESSLAIYACRTNEEEMIAREINFLLKK
ncbi:acetate kinase [Spiroplasma sabaudiense Ar-1343]|uniref:Acetate kinase n=1 Tax=Spiroplasma sabaudiense Ar-1343 TaxID=1276257 RepID=W6AA96_9MOLU|nr:acetate kinase [Spiroplasma sabaudiense]AHI54113.1 acetate kinase [Spiroplasma sabaudiense Ar-1343]